MHLHNVLIKPNITEKSLKKAKEAVYCFSVAKAVSKRQIRQAVEELYKVKIAKITVVSRSGKWRRVGKKQVRKKLPSTKLAYVKVTNGSIDLFPKE